MVLCCNTYRALIVSKEPQKSLFWIRVFLKSPEAHLRGPKRPLRGPCYELLACGGMGSQFQIMRRGAPQSLFFRGPELLSTALATTPKTTVSSQPEQQPQPNMQQQTQLPQQHSQQQQGPRSTRPKTLAPTTQSSQTLRQSQRLLNRQQQSQH